MAIKLKFLTEQFDRFINGVNEKRTSTFGNNKIKVMSLGDFVEKSLTNEKIETDIDASGQNSDMLGSKFSTLPPAELKQYLGRISGDEKTKLDKYKNPYIHKKNVPIKNDETGEDFDLDKLKSDITQRPGRILKQNEKIMHSGGGATVYYNIGFPALKGLAVNEKTGEFVIVDTCPGAGACKVYCFAKKGAYIMWKASSMSQTRLLNFLLNDPDGFKNKLIGELTAEEVKYKNKDVGIRIRWHDAGDFFSDAYLKLAYEVARTLPNIEFYAYTKIAGVASGEKPKNFKMNFSSGALPSEENQIDFEKTKHAIVVKKDVFGDLIVKKGNTIEKDARGKYVYVDGGIETLKDRMSLKYKIPRSSILTYDEMINIPVGEEPRYNVIVGSGDGDDAATRNDVLGTYLLIH